MSSCSPRCPQWEREAICTRCPDFNSSRIQFYPKDPCSPLDLELIQDACDCRLYVNILSIQAPCNQGDTKTTSLTLIINQSEYEILAHRFEGGQRLLLPPHARDLILSSLLNGEPITLKLSRHQRTFPPTGFPRAYS